MAIFKIVTTITSSRREKKNSATNIKGKKYSKAGHPCSVPYSFSELISDTKSMPASGKHVNLRIVPLTIKERNTLQLRIHCHLNTHLHN